MFNHEPATLLIVLLLAVLPSLVWLFFYLKEDPHPEPKSWLFIIFITGIALAPIVIFLEMILNKFLTAIPLLSILDSSLLVVFIAPLIEELSKYGVVHLTLDKNPVLDEPVDGMIYVIVSALGFAAIENVFAIFSYIPVGAPDFINATLNYMSLRFISAVAVHGLASGIVGYYFAYYYFIKRRWQLIVFGLVAATILHGLFNYFISHGDRNSLFIVGLLLGGTAALVIYFFNRLKHFKIYQAVEL